MNRQRVIKLVHAVGTAWFLFAAAVIVIQALQQAGVSSWVIFSVSGYSTGTIFVLVSVYLFAIFRGGSRHQACTVEHPLTGSANYMILYSVIPFLGAAAGLLCKMGVECPQQAKGTVVMGTLAATLTFWILVDPAIALIETLLPQSRLHRALRINAARDLVLQQQKHNEQLLAEIEQNEQTARALWTTRFKDDAQTLADLIENASNRQYPVKTRAIEIGLSAFKYGGLECMETVSEMTAAITKKYNSHLPATRYISNWWDGIGDWRDDLNRC